MPETNQVTCYLCGREGSTLEMAPAAAPTLGHHLDFAMAAVFFCPDPCFQTYKHSPQIQHRVHQWQDAAATWARACVSGCLDETLIEMEELPEGLRVTASERDRLSQLSDRLEQPGELQSDEDNHLLYKICRNINRNPFQHSATGMRKDYNSLREDFEKLERLS